MKILVILMFGLLYSTVFTVGDAVSSPLAALSSPGNAAAKTKIRKTDTIDDEVAEKTDGSTFFSRNTLAELQVFIEDFSLRSYWRLAILNINKVRLSHDIKKALNNLARLSGFSNFVAMTLAMAMVLLPAAATEWLFRFIVLRKYVRTPSGYPLTWAHRIRKNLSRTVPQFASLAFFCAATYVFYILIYSSHFSLICPFFLSFFIGIVVIRLFIVACNFFLAPAYESIRLTDWDNHTVRIVFRNITLLFSILTFGIAASSMLRYGGLGGDSLILVQLLFGTMLITATEIIVFLNRKTIARFINPESEKTSDGSGQNISYTWISLLIIYLFALWLIWGSRLVLFESKVTLAFVISLFILPIFCFLDGVVGWGFELVRHALTARKNIDPEESSPDEYDCEPSLLGFYLRTMSRFILAGLLLLWLFNLWGLHFPYTPVILSSLRKVIVVFVIFFFLWQLVDKSIESFITRKEKVAEEDDDDEDDSGESEWGDSPLLDRSQTLLPIVRKFLGVVIFTMLVLFTLSSLGINIGPLLAGAGVMGIAIGFGAQKLVSDLLSGFFYLVDDAFRVGEYIEAGSIKGSVEKITLRNIMLRHHRGMLQIIPYSDLGAITNFMRGGIVVKFNLQFPYDTNVDMVRKIVKRVGIEMLEDEEFGDNFIKQMKSQGIREVGDSVLTIRVKFTAKPGTHFVIRREAYLRITEALNAKGIYYAHRKVIVDFPDSINTEESDEQTKRKLLEAGAAASLAVDKNTQQAKE